MGDCGAKVQVDAINENNWFHKRQVHSFYLFASIILINYLRLDFTYKVIGNQIQDLVDYI